MLPDPLQRRRFESVAKHLAAFGLLCLVAFPLQAADPAAFFHVGVPAVEPVPADPSPLDLEEWLEAAVPDRAVPVVEDPCVRRGPPDRQEDGVSGVPAFAPLPVVFAGQENPEDFRAVGQVDVRDLALGTVHGVRENGVPLIQELGDLLGVRVADVLLFHGVFLSGLMALSI